ncbi:MAG: DUF1015 domain-containing protein [Armatimonadota bacterium]|nr:DUF1015 domain-containing protein [Armatimonadota bacterium]
MAEIKPFRGVRYDQSIVGDLSKVVCPPYDVISPQDRVYYHNLHPNNYVRLVLGEEYENDTEENNRFTRARAYLDRWLSDGVLKQDPVSAIYVYEQTFQYAGEKRSVLGFTCAVKLYDYSARVILPHENTLAKPKSDLIRLIRAVRTNLDCVYGLYADEQRTVDSLLHRTTLQEPVAAAVDKDGVRHRLWTLTDESAIRKIVETLAPCQIAIADGHHRYETALAYRSECRQGKSESDVLPCDYVLMTLVNVYQKDLTVFPTHRVIKGLADEDLKQLNARLPELFDIQTSTPETLLQDMRARGAIGMFSPQGAFTLKSKPQSHDLIPGSEASRRLELNLLHKLILERILGIDEEKLRHETHVLYTRDPKEAVELVCCGRGQVAFLLNHIDVRSVLEIAAAGERMPQKATYFYPKLLSGLVARLHTN